MLLTLDGGFRYGEITSLAGAPGMGKTALAYHAVEGHLLARCRGAGAGAGAADEEGGEAAVIDTTATFSLVWLRDVLVERLRGRERGVGRAKNGVGEGAGLDAGVVEKATAMMDRVRLMRVFDMAGVMEAIGEIGETREGRTASEKEATKEKVVEMAAVHKG